LNALSKILTKREHLEFENKMIWQKMRFGRDKLRKELVKNCEARLIFFSNRVVNSWNSLPGCVVNSIDVNKVKENFVNCTK